MFEFFAYIDPGTGSFAIQAVIGTIMGVTYAARHRIRVIAGKLRKKKGSDNDTPPTNNPENKS
jgi:hypothetical protein